MIAAASWPPRAPPALRTTVFTAVAAIADAAGLEQCGPVGGMFDDELFTQDAGHARVYLPVRESPALDGTGVRWELPANPLDTPDATQWRTEVCWPLAPAGAQAD